MQGGSLGEHSLTHLLTGGGVWGGGRGRREFGGREGEVVCKQCSSIKPKQG